MGLIVAVEDANIARIDFWLSQGARINARLQDDVFNTYSKFLRRSYGDAEEMIGMTPLTWAAYKARGLDLFGHLVERGADVNVTDWTGCTALDIARAHLWSSFDYSFHLSEDNHRAMIAFLKSRGAACPCSEKRYASGAFTDEEEEAINRLKLRDALRTIELLLAHSHITESELASLLKWGDKMREVEPYGIWWAPPARRSEDEHSMNKERAEEAARRLLADSAANRTVLIQCLRKIYQRQHATSSLPDLGPQ
jgi:hypothetical protein